MAVHSSSDSGNAQKMRMPDDITDSKIHRRLGELIEALIEDGDIGSERKLSRITDVSFTALANWSNLRSDPQLFKLMKLAYSIGWSMTELMCFAEGDENPKAAISRKKQKQSLKVS